MEKNKSNEAGVSNATNFNPTFLTARSKLGLLMPPEKLITSAILAGFTAVCLLYALLIPAWLPYDEPSHFYYVAHLAGLPRFLERGSYEQFIQPPIAYLVYSPFLRLITFFGATIQVQLLTLRFVTIGESVIFLFLTLRLISILLGRHQLKLLLLATSGVIMAFNPSFIAVSSTVNNDVGMYVLVEVALLLAIDLVQLQDIHSWKWKLIVLGIILGIASSTKALALPLLVLPVAVILIRWFFHNSKQLPVVWIGVSVCIAFLVGTPFYLYNLANYNDPFGQNYLHSISPGSHPTKVSEIISFFSMSFATFWSFVNYLRNSLVIKPKFFEYLPFLGLTLIPLVALVFAIFRRQLLLIISPERILTITAMILIILSYIYKNTQEFSPEGRFIFAAIGLFSMVIVLSIEYLIPSRKISKVVLIAIIIFMPTYSIYAALQYFPTAPNLFPNLYQ